MLFSNLRDSIDNNHINQDILFHYPENYRYNQIKSIILGFKKIIIINHYKQSNRYVYIVELTHFLQK